MSGRQAFMRGAPKDQEHGRRTDHSADLRGLTMNLTNIDLQEHLQSGDRVVTSLAREILRLRDGIRSHREKSGHELCWLNDLELWKLLDPNARYPHDTLPVREEFLTQCGRFYESRLKGTPYEEPKAKRTILSSKDTEQS